MAATLLILLALGGLILMASHSIDHPRLKNLDQVVGWSLVVLALVLLGYFYL